jgi:hypothetical protein
MKHKELPLIEPTSELKAKASQRTCTYNALTPACTCVDINSILGLLRRVNEGSVSEIFAASIFTVLLRNLGELQCMQILRLCFFLPVKSVSVISCAFCP